MVEFIDGRVTWEDAEAASNFVNSHPTVAARQQSGGVLEAKYGSSRGRNIAAMACLIAARRRSQMRTSLNPDEVQFVGGLRGSDLTMERIAGILGIPHTWLAQQMHRSAA